jgi:hypothetical protein
MNHKVYCRLVSISQPSTGMSEAERCGRSSLKQFKWLSCPYSKRKVHYGTICCPPGLADVVGMLNIILNTEKHLYTLRRNMAMSKYVQPVSTVTLTPLSLQRAPQESQRVMSSILGKIRRWVSGRARHYAGLTEWLTDWLTDWSAVITWLSIWIGKGLSSRYPYGSHSVVFTIQQKPFVQPYTT